uniref:Uncharacterized protein n=1 Tax=Arundo donax TaxID=35708 RepID=A0A0A9C6S5_ARUDO
MCLVEVIVRRTAMVFCIYLSCHVRSCRTAHVLNAKWLSLEIPSDVTAFSLAQNRLQWSD